MDAALHHLKDKRSKIQSVLELGTGSGCVAVAIAKNAPNKKIKITATDISPNALAVAKKNARTHKVKITFLKSDLLHNVSGDFDIIIANLPYGWKGVKQYGSPWGIKGDTSLAYEPGLALYSGSTGLTLINKLLLQLKQLKQKPKVIFLEFDPRQKNALQQSIRKQLPNVKISFFKDLRNQWRYVALAFE